MRSLPVGILLAAGEGRRFGANKLLHPVMNDTAMLFTSAALLKSILPNVIVVINEALTDYSAQLQSMGLQVVINTEAKQGIGNSIACGVTASKDAASWLIALADMPYIQADTVSLLVEKLQAGADIVAPVFDGQRGHPVGFHQRYAQELMQLKGDVGARSIIKRQIDMLSLVEVDDDGVLKDIDYSVDIAE